MKKLLIAAIAVFAFGAANAQEGGTGGFSKGDIFISGSFGFGSQKYTAEGNYKEDSFNIMPRVGYFVSENIALGLGLGYSSSSVQVNEGADKDKVNTIGVQAFGRYYFTPASQFSVFGQLSVEYASADFDPVKVNGFGVGLAPGVNYFLSKNFALEASWGVLSYASAKSDVDGAESSTDFNLGLDLDNINLGLVYKF
jgi:outer membrane protein